MHVLGMLIIINCFYNYYNYQHLYIFSNAAIGICRVGPGVRGCLILASKACHENYQLIKLIISEEWPIK